MPDSASSAASVSTEPLKIAPPGTASTVIVGVAGTYTASPRSLENVSLMNCTEENKWMPAGTLSARQTTDGPSVGGTS